jgi:hypothetical protein
MYILKWEPLGKIGRYSIVKANEVCREDNNCFENEFLDFFSEKVKRYNEIAQSVDEEGLPRLNSDPNLTDSKYPLWSLAENTNLGVMEIPFNRIIEFSKDNYYNNPKNSLIRDSLVCYLKIGPELVNVSDSVEPIKAFKIFNNYFVEKSDHRIIAKILIGDKLIKAHVYDVDYLSMLKKSILLKYPYGYCIGIRREDDPELYMIHDIDEYEKSSYVDLMDEHGIKLYIKDYTASFRREFID